VLQDLIEAQLPGGQMEEHEQYQIEEQIVPQCIDAATSSFRSRTSSAVATTPALTRSRTSPCIKGLDCFSYIF
jgi:hypothetical protein